MNEINTHDTVTEHMQQLAVGSLAKWSQMIVTGKPVTPEQAKEIIFLTDSFLTDPSDYAGGNASQFNRWYRSQSGLDRLNIEQKYPEGHTYQVTDWVKYQSLLDALGVIRTSYVTNDWASCCFIGGPHGWCHPNGTISFFDNVGKWPSLTEIYEDWAAIAGRFPYLDLNVTLMNAENVEDHAAPVINFRVVGGLVTPQSPDLSVHTQTRGRVLDINGLVDSLLHNPSRELGLPSAWYEEFAHRVLVEVEKLMA